MKSPQTKTQEVETREFSAGYTVHVFEDGGVILSKGTNTWSDPVRAMSHLAGEIGRVRKEVLEEVMGEIKRKINPAPPNRFVNLDDILETIKQLEDK